MTISDICFSCGQEMPYPAEPPEKAVVVDGEDDAWQHRRGGWQCVLNYVERDVSWAELNRTYGPVKVVYTP